MLKQSLFKQLKSFYLRNKVSDFEYDCVRSEIYNTNKSMLLVCSFISMVLFFFLAGFSIFFKNDIIFKNPYPYGIMFILLLVIYIISLKLPENKISFSTFLVYLFIVLFGGFTLYSDIFEKNTTLASTWFVFEFAAPIIFVDKIRRMYLFTFIIGITFTALTIWQKDLSLAKVDICYNWVFFILGYLPSFYLTKIRVREFSLRQIIETERDHDDLTGLLNKSAFTRDAKKSIAATKNGILIIMDLDFFKEVNDTYGHFVGDSVLKMTGLCIQRTFRGTDVMGRFGGDEFVILMANTTNVEIAQVRCDSLIKMLNETHIIPENKDIETTIHASIGFALYDGQPDFESLFKNSDTALYYSKNNGKDRATKYTVQLES